MGLLPTVEMTSAAVEMTSAAVDMTTAVDHGDGFHVFSGLRATTVKELFACDPLSGFERSFCAPILCQSSVLGRDFLALRAHLAITGH